MGEKINQDEIRREQAKLLRKNGMGLRRIADVTELTLDAVRNLCRKITPPETDENLHIRMNNKEACVFCGTPVEQHGGAGRPRRFCSDYCRRQYWRLHREEQKKNPDIIFTRICRYCGEPFEIYGKNDRKYCCRDHYLKHCYGDKEERERNYRKNLLENQLAELTRSLA